jgi:hypothetical protein
MQTHRLFFQGNFVFRVNMKRIIRKKKHTTTFFKTISVILTGDITQKGYDKKRNKLLAPYMRQNKELQQQQQQQQQQQVSFISVSYF